METRSLAGSAAAAAVPSVSVDGSTFEFPEMTLDKLYILFSISSGIANRFREIKSI